MAMLARVLPHANGLNIDRVLVSGDENIGSRRAIENNGGVLERQQWDESLERTSNFIGSAPLR